KVQADIALAAQRARPLGMPVLLGEFGVINTIPDAQRAPWYRTVRKAAESHGMGWTAWQFVVSGHVYDLATEAWKAPIYQALFDRPPPKPAIKAD
ncbi:MAG: hypothetical protein EBZ50_06560, partial [Alphaproteobacteria bacterium]|nr:hypothetical protein [Alphaproteobacteria bacterium]